MLSAASFIATLKPTSVWNGYAGNFKISSIFSALGNSLNSRVHWNGSIKLQVIITIINFICIAFIKTELQSAYMNVTMDWEKPIT